MPRIHLAALAVIAVLLGVAATAAPAATTSAIVVNQLYAGGGNAGASYANDYVELFNRGSSAVDLTGWTLQYASSASTSWSATALAGSVPAGGHYLVQLASGGSVGAALPAADATGTSNLAASGGKVAVVRAATPLTCGATAGSCATQAIEDLVGYGTATDYEGTAAAPALTSTTAAVRDGTGCSDTDDNAADFSTAAPSPHNSTTAAGTCGVATTPASTGIVSVVLDLQPVLSLSLNRSTVSFGTVLAGAVPAPVSVAATVVSNSATGYALSVHRTSFSPSDLQLAISARAADPLVAVPIATDLRLAQTTAASAAAGDVWTTSLGFLAALPALNPGRYTTTITYTVVAR